MAKKSNKQLIVLAWVFISLGCTINYEDGSGTTEKSETIPDSVMENFSLVQMRNNSPYTEINASKTEIYNTQNKTLLYDAVFREYNSNDNTISTEGKANYIEFYNDTEDAKITGDLNFYSQKDEIDMKGEYLYWASKDKVISSKEDSLILITKEDGSVIEGFGFSANIKNSTFSFVNSVTGVTP